MTDPLAAHTYQPVKRAARGPGRVAGRSGAFSGAHAVTYPDGVVLRVEVVGRRVEQGVGRGVFHGRSQTVLSLVLQNGSGHPIALNAVVVTMTYGSPARISPPVYEDAAAQDFSGTVKPGGKALARYVFAVPAGQRGKATTVVDFDAVHTAATFTGAV